MIQERKGMNDATDTKNIDPKRKKYIDFTLRNFVKKQLDSIVEVSEVLDALPDNQIRTVIDAEHHIIGLLKLLEEISSTCLAPIEFDEKGNPYATYQFQLAQNLDVPFNGKDQIVLNVKCRFPAEPWEVEFAKKLGTQEYKPYMRVLTSLFENEFGLVRYNMDDENYTQWLADLSNKRGQIPQIEMGKQWLFGAAEISEDLLEEAGKLEE